MIHAHDRPPTTPESSPPTSSPCRIESTASSLRRARARARVVVPAHAAATQSSVAFAVVGRSTIEISTTHCHTDSTAGIRSSSGRRRRDEIVDEMRSTILPGQQQGLLLCRHAQDFALSLSKRATLRCRCLRPSLVELLRPDPCVASMQWPENRLRSPAAITVRAPHRGHYTHCDYCIAANFS